MKGPIRGRRVWFRCKYHDWQECHICRSLVNECDQTNEQDEDGTAPPAKRARKDQMNPTLPQEIDTGALFAFTAPLRFEQIRTAASLLMSAYLKLRVEDKPLYTEDNDNMNPL